MTRENSMGKDSLSVEPMVDKASDRISILAVDDHPLFRRGVGAVLAKENDMELVAEASNGEEAIHQVRKFKPDVVLMDLRMPVLGGVESLSVILSEYPGTSVLALTTYHGDVEVLRALKAGARGYLLKNSVVEDLAEAIRNVRQGRRYIPSEIAERLADHAAEPLLSKREVEVLMLVALGHSNLQTSRELSISEDTVKTHMKNIMSKLNAKDRTHAVTIGVRRGIIST
jgi:DNA-binding NarL/FixJ family response regulator